MKLNEVNLGVHKHAQALPGRPRPGLGQRQDGGRGHKGQGALAGWSAAAVFQGGTMPLVRRIPKRGFHNRFAVNVATVNLRDLERVFQAGDEVTAETLRAKGLAKRPYDELKVLGTGELTKRLKVSAHRFSESAQAKIIQAGGEVVVLPGRRSLSKKREQQA